MWKKLYIMAVVIALVGAIIYEPVTTWSANRPGIINGYAVVDSLVLDVANEDVILYRIGPAHIGVRDTLTADDITVVSFSAVFVDADSAQIDTLRVEELYRNGTLIGTYINGLISTALTDSGFVHGPSGATDGYIPLFDGITGRLLKDGPANNSTNWNAAHAWVASDSAAVNLLRLWAAADSANYNTAYLQSLRLADIPDTLANYGVYTNKLVTSNLYAVSLLDAGLVGYWPLKDLSTIAGADTLSYDFSHNGNSVDVYGAAVTDSALYFDGTDWGNLGTTSDIDIGSGDFTFTGWFNCASTPIAGYLFNKGLIGASGFTIDFTDTGRIFARLYNGGTIVSAYTEQNRPPNTWIFVSVTCDRDGNMVLRINNAAAIYANQTKSIAAIAGDISGGTAYFGQYSTGTGKMTGAIAEVRMYNRLLPASAQTEIYNLGR
jgi:hypothetical protein